MNRRTFLSTLTAAAVGLATGMGLQPVEQRPWKPVPGSRTGLVKYDREWHLSRIGNPAEWDEAPVFGSRDGIWAWYEARDGKLVNMLETE